MNPSPILRIAPSTLEKVISTLEVKFVALSQCYVSSGYRLELPGADTPGIHYNLSGYGKIRVGNDKPVDLAPHTMIIVPAHEPFRIEALPKPEAPNPPRVVKGDNQQNVRNNVRQFIAGEAKPEINLICGFFRATYGSNTDLFESLSSPIIEQFGDGDALEQKLGFAMEELAGDHIGGSALGASLVKQVIVALLRRSLTSLNNWVENFSILGDPGIAKAFAEMAADPGGDHTVISLADTACLGRSVFMARFTELFGRPPMAVLRELRMRQAHRQLEEGDLSLDRIAKEAGYRTRNSFTKAFRLQYHIDPARLTQPTLR